MQSCRRGKVEIEGILLDDPDGGAGRLELRPIQQLAGLEEIADADDLWPHRLIHLQGRERKKLIGARCEHGIGQIGRRDRSSRARSGRSAGIVGHPSHRDGRISGDPQSLARIDPVRVPDHVTVEVVDVPPAIGIHQVAARQVPEGVPAVHLVATLGSVGDFLCRHCRARAEQGHRDPRDNRCTARHRVHPPLLRMAGRRRRKG